MARWLLLLSATVASFAFFSRTNILSEVLDAAIELSSEYISNRNHISSDQDISSLRSGSSHDHWNVLHHMGGNSPWVQKTEEVVNGSVDIPPGCRIDQVHMVGVTLSFLSTAFF